MCRGKAVAHCPQIVHTKQSVRASVRVLYRRSSNTSQICSRESAGCVYNHGRTAHSPSS